jgi:hypothetical protein
LGGLYRQIGHDFQREPRGFRSLIGKESFGNCPEGRRAARLVRAFLPVIIISYWSPDQNFNFSFSFTHGGCNKRTGTSAGDFQATCCKISLFISNSPRTLSTMDECARDYLICFSGLDVETFYQLPSLL